MIRLERCWLSLTLFLGFTLSGYGATLSQLLQESGAQLSWHSWQQRGELIYEDRRVFFIVEHPYLIFSNGMVVSAKIYQADGIISFDGRSSQLVSHFLRTGKILSSREIVDTYRISTILIDPGHGGRDSGAVGRHGVLVVQEKAVTLAVSLRLAQLLRSSYPEKEILLTRTSDTYPTLQERVDMANNLPLAEGEVAIFISIHANAALNRHARGFEVWHLPPAIRRDIYQGEEDSAIVQDLINEFVNQEIIAGGRRLAEFLRQSFSRKLSDRTVDRGLREEAWFVVRGAHTVAVLVELGFVSNEAEARLLASKSYQDELAAALHEGIVGYIRYFER